MVADSIMVKVCEGGLVPSLKSSSEEPQLSRLKGGQSVR